MNTDLLINGENSPAASGERFDVLSPSTGNVIGSAARASAPDVDKAIAAARSGFNIWSALAPKDREKALLKAADIIAAEGEARLLDLLIDESGSVITKAKGEIAYTVDLLRTAAGEARRLYGDTFPNDNPGRVSMVVREPLGVVAVVSPYNAPLSLLAKMAAFPIAAGNAVVIKPSEETPLIAVQFAKILIEAGVPANVVNVVTGFGTECGKPLTEHNDIDGIALTGSTETGKLVGAAAIQKMKRMQLELGGKSAIIVCGDVDVEEAAITVAEGIFNHAGQICMANSRVIVDAAIADAFNTAIKAVAESLTIGDVREPKSLYGPLINQTAINKVQAHVDDAVAKGATLLTGGKVREGLVYEPTILVGTSEDTTAWCEESFAPMCSVVTATSLEEAIEIANNSDYGLSAAVLTNNIKWGLRAARGIKAGSVHIGMHSFQSNALAPIGGFGMSGIGKSGGKYSTEEFTELKWISIEVDG